MSNPLLDAAIKEAYGKATSSVEYINTLEISQIGVSEPIRICQGYINRNLTVPGEGVQTFLATPFRFNLPKVDDGGLQELSLTFDNVDRRIADFCRSALTYAAPIEIKFRPYLASDTTTPKMDPPLLLFLTNVVIDATTVSGRAVQRDFINTKFPNFKYSLTNFPGLANL